MSKSENEKRYEKIRKQHPLFNRDFCFSLTWKEWKKLFTETKQAHEAVGLLHHGFEVDVDYEQSTERERVSFYLKVAYGYNNETLFRLADDSDNRFLSIFGRHSVTEARMEIAQKAWSVLCQKFFKNRDSDDLPLGWRIITDREGEKLLEKVFWFFSDKINIPVAPPIDHNDRIVTGFLLKLAEMIWNNRYSLGKQLRETFDRHRGLLIWILWQMKRLDFLVEQGNVRESVTDRDLKTLRKLALFESRNSDQEQEHSTVEEAAVEDLKFAASPAQTFAVLDLLSKGRARKEKKKQAEFKIREAQKELERLNK